MFQAFVNADFDTFVSLTHPAVTRLAGGRIQMVALVQSGLQQMRSQGTTFRSVSVARPTQVVRAGTERHAILPMKLVMVTPRGAVHVDSHLLGVSIDQGRSWTFIDTAKFDAHTIKTVLPGYNPELRLPPKTAPRLVPAGAATGQ
jgi:hypothetical protein